MMKQKILIVGGSHSEIPLIQAAKELGLYVVTTGNQQNGLGHRYADKYYAADYSDKKAIYALAKEIEADYLCFGAHDLSLFSTVYAASQLGIGCFDDMETTELLHHKDKFKEFAAQYGILTPKAYAFDTPASAMDFARKMPVPFIVKPTDMGGGKGICIVQNVPNADVAIRNAFEYTKNGRIVIEEFFEGELHSLSMFIQNQKVVFYYADNEYPCPQNPYGVCTSTSPASGFEQVRDILIAQSEKVAKLLKLKDGLLHMQYLQNGDEVAIIEFTRRMPGDMYNVPVEYSTGVAYAKNILRLCCGMQMDIEFRAQKKFISRHCITARSCSDVVYAEAIESNIVDKVIWCDSQGIEKKGVVFLTYDSEREMVEKTDRLDELIRVKG